LKPRRFGAALDPVFTNFCGFFSKEPENIISLAGFKGASERPMLFERQKRIFYL
jgi:hypothetical protein